MSVERRLRAAVRRLLDRVGLDVRLKRGAHYHHMDAFLDQQRLIGRRVSPTIFDVGANRGQTTARYAALFPGARVFAFEPSPDAYAALVDKTRQLANVRTLPQAVAEVSGTATLFRNADDVTDSLLTVARGSEAFVDSGMTDRRGEAVVSVVSLDAFCDAETIPRIDILKMDIQGAELRALRGASRLLNAQAIDVIYSEVLFASLYDDQARFCELHSFLEQRGYCLYGVYNATYGQQGTLAWADALYLSPAIRDQHATPKP